MIDILIVDLLNIMYIIFQEKDGFHDDIIYEPDEGEESDDDDDGWTKEKKGQNMQKLTHFVLEGIR